MRHVLACLALAAAALLLAASASAAPASPAEASPLPARPAGLTLPTGLFGLGSVDLLTLGLGSSGLGTVGPIASASTASGNPMLIVDDGFDCPNAQFTTIQSAVAAAPAGATIKVCPGTYVEQVTIPAGKNGLRLFSEGHLQAIIKAPAVMAPPQAIVRIQAQSVSLTHFTITGPGGTPCDSIRYGVFVDNGSATIEHNHITEIRDTPLGGCQNGLAVLVGRGSVSSVGVAEVDHNLIDKYQKGGVVVDFERSYANVHHNVVRWTGPTATIAPNGIQVSRGAGGDVNHNEVSGNSFAVPTFAGTGILLFEPGSGVVSVGYNEVFGNDDGISLYTAEGEVVEHNYSHDQLSSDGIYMGSDTAGNRIAYNRAEFNPEHDCHDDSGTPTTTDNFWIKDYGLTENKPGLCRKASP